MNLLAVAVVMGALLQAWPAAADPAGDATAARATFLREEIKLARTRGPYLVLDAAGGMLHLRRQHVDLLALPVRAGAGIPGWATAGDIRWPAASFTLESPLSEPDRPRLDPPRRAPGDTTAAPPVTVEAIQAARDRFLEGLPAHYRLSFAPDLEVVVVGEASRPTMGDRWHRGGRRLHESLRGLSDWLARRPPRLRLLLVMSPADARRLYLALEPGIFLLVAPTGETGP